MIGYLTRGEMLDQIGQHTQALSTAKRSIAATWLDSHYHDFATRYRWPQLMKSEEAGVTFSSNVPYVYLSPDVDQLYAILPNNMAGLSSPMNIEALLQQGGATYQYAGLFDKYADAGEFPRRYEFLVGGEQLSVAQTGYVATSTAYVNGIQGAVPGNPTSYEAGESVTVNATAGVYTNLPSGATYYDVTSFSVAANASGTYLLKGVTSGTIYAVISAGDTSARYKRIRLMSTPADAPVVTMFWKKRVKRLIADSQTIEIPVAYALIDKTIASMYSAQREYNAAMQYHDGRAEAECERAFTGTKVEGENIELGQPTINNRNRKIVIITPAAGP
jgi:hypothetical protein